jgi:hypothetical protein
MFSYYSRSCLLSRRLCLFFYYAFYLIRMHRFPLSVSVFSCRWNVSCVDKWLFRTDIKYYYALEILILLVLSNTFCVLLKCRL